MAIFRLSRSLPRQPSNQKNKGGWGEEKVGPRLINVSMLKDIEVHHAEKACKPTHNNKKDSKDIAEEDDAKTQDLYKRTRSILNKLTPQKFQTLVSQMKALQIDSEYELKGVIDLVFEKAISEPNFSLVYANMCRCLSMGRCTSEQKPGDMVNFRAMLLTRCQREFEKDNSSEQVFVAKRQELEKETDEAKQKEMKQELEYVESKAKRRSGNIRFIGELFKLKMLPESIMHDCVFKLLRTKDPENLKCLCCLLTTIGKKLETVRAKRRMDQYFTQMGEIVKEKKMSSRVRFMLQDVIELRASNWVPRRADNNPKTIEQIHNEAAQEAQQQALSTQLAIVNQSWPPTGRRGPPCSQDGWNTVGQRITLKVDRRIDPAKRKLSKVQQVDEQSIQLGPGGGAGLFAGWGRGSTGGGGGRASQEKEKPAGPGNRSMGSSSTQSVDQSRERGRVPDVERSRSAELPPPATPAMTALTLTEAERNAILDEYLQLLDRKKLEFTKGEDSAPSTPTTGLPMKDVRDNLHKLIVASKVDNENFFDWIESNVDIPTTKQAQFVRELMTGVCESSISQTLTITNVCTKTEVDFAEIKLRNSLLQSAVQKYSLYLDHQAESEQQALYALHAPITPLHCAKGLLREMYDIMFDEDMISQGVYLLWEKTLFT